jgi:hypothetical protein
MFETIQNANDGKIPGATRNEIGYFTNTANNPGDDPTSRPGFHPDEAREPRMTIAQGRALIQKILDAWIKELILKDSSAQP